MRRTIMLALSKFKPGTIPAKLLGNGSVPLDKLSVSVLRLCHHMLRDTFDILIPKMNPLFPLYQKLISSSPALEFIAGGLGSHKEAKVAESMKIGKAFCRWFLAEHFQMTYFGHMDHLLDKAPLPQYGGIRVERKSKGDTADYLCSDSKNVFLAEAKGRQDKPIGFKGSAFATWRKQFTRINVLDANGKLKKVKGYIVATRLKMANQPKAVSKIFAEDPHSPGETELTADEVPGVRRLVIHNHYSGVFDILGLSLHATALREGILVPGEPVVVGIWRCPIPPLNGLRFMGGFLPSPDADAGAMDVRWLLDPHDLRWIFRELGRDLRMAHLGWNPNLGAGHRTFFGLESQLFKGVLEETRQTAPAPPVIEPLALAEQTLPEQISLLRDGTLLAPASFMRLEDVALL